MRFPALFIAAQLDSVASTIFSPGDNVFQEQFTETAAPVFVTDYQVLHESPGSGAVGKVGYDKEHHGAHNLALRISDKELLPWVSANLGEYSSVIVLRRIPARLNMRRGDSQFTVKLQDAGNILLGSQSDNRYLLQDLIVSTSSIGQVTLSVNLEEGVTAVNSFFYIFCFESHITREIRLCFGSFTRNRAYLDFGSQYV